MNHRASSPWGAACGLLGLSLVLVSHGADLPRTVGKNLQQIGRITHPMITESSGVVASRTQTNVFWTHTDGGRRPILHAMTRTGTPLADFAVAGVRIDDWEDIATDNHGKLYIADTGNNDAKRTELTVYQIEEPRLASRPYAAVPVSRTWRLRFPAGPFDCEALFVWNDAGYVVSKVFQDARAELYRFSLTNTTPTQVLEKVATLTVDSPVTGVDISADGRRLGIVAKNGAYVGTINGNPASAADVKLHHTKFKDHIEACTFVADGLLATSESREIYLFTHPDFLP